MDVRRSYSASVAPRRLHGCRVQRRQGSEAERTVGVLHRRTLRFPTRNADGLDARPQSGELEQEPPLRRCGPGEFVHLDVLHAGARAPAGCGLALLPWPQAPGACARSVPASQHPHLVKQRLSRAQIRSGAGLEPALAVVLLRILRIPTRAVGRASRNADPGARPRQVPERVDPQVLRKSVLREVQVDCGHERRGHPQVHAVRLCAQRSL